MCIYMILTYFGLPRRDFARDKASQIIGYCSILLCIIKSLNLRAFFNRKSKALSPLQTNVSHRITGNGFIGQYILSSVLCFIFFVKF